MPTTPSRSASRSAPARARASSSASASASAREAQRSRSDSRSASAASSASTSAVAAARSASVASTSANNGASAASASLSSAAVSARPPSRRSISAATASSRDTTRSRSARTRSTWPRRAPSSPRASAACPLGGATPSAQSDSNRSRSAARACSARSRSSSSGTIASASPSTSASSGAQPRALGLERGDDRPVYERRPVAFDAPLPLAEHGDDAPGPLAQRLVTGEHVAEVVLAARGELGFERHDRGVEPGELGALGTVALTDLAPQLGDTGHAVAQAGEVAPGEMALQSDQFGDHRSVAAGCVGLTFQRAQLAAHLAQQVGHAGQVDLGRVETPLGLLLALAVLEDTSRFLDDQAAFLGSSVEHCVDLSLRHDHVLLTSHTGVGQQLLQIEQPARRRVDRVFRLARAKQGAGDGDLGEVDRQQPGAVVDRERHLGATERRAGRGTGEDDVVHLLGSHRGRGLGAEHPGDGVDHVRLAAPVGTDDDGHPRLQIEDGRLGEGLEPLEGQRLQEHAANDSAGTTPV